MVSLFLFNFASSRVLSCSSATKGPFTVFVCRLVAVLVCCCVVIVACDTLKEQSSMLSRSSTDIVVSSRDVGAYRLRTGVLSSFFLIVIISQEGQRQDCFSPMAFSL